MVAGLGFEDCCRDCVGCRDCWWVSEDPGIDREADIVLFERFDCWEMAPPEKVTKKSLITITALRNYNLLSDFGERS